MMPTTNTDKRGAAAILDSAYQRVQGIEQMSLQASAAEAYSIQNESIQLRLARGERLIGIKMGMTSKAKMVQVNLQEILWGRLTDAMLRPNGGTLERARFIQPRAEPEIAFRLKAPLSGTVTELEAHAAIEGVAPAMEILDSRFKNFKFNVADAIADNLSSSALFIGPWHSPDTDFSNLGMVMDIDGRPVGIGSSSAILGDPIRTLVEAARLTALFGGSLRAGDIFMSGASTAAVPLQAGQKVRLRVQSLGECSFSVI
jgi:2-oxo-3-hexenedioate decarboxylase